MAAETFDSFPEECRDLKRMMVMMIVMMMTMIVMMRMVIRMMIVIDSKTLHEPSELCAQLSLTG